MGNFMFVVTNSSMELISENMICDPRTLNQAVQFVQRKKMMKQT